MTPTRWFIVLFWLVVIGMLLKQFYNFEKAKEREGALAAQQHYFFGHMPEIAVRKPPPPPAAGADVRQVNFTSEPNTPTAGFFTCLVTLKNEGLTKATDVQVNVRPYRGTRYGSIEVGHIGTYWIKDSEILGQYGSWVSFPDLAPGQSSTQSVVLMDHPNVSPGYNPHPEIKFQTAK